MIEKSRIFFYNATITVVYMTIFLGKMYITIEVLLWIQKNDLEAEPDKIELTNIQDLIKHSYNI